MEVARMSVRVLEAETSLAEVDLSRDPCVHHPLQRAVDGRAADSMIFLADQFDEIVSGEVSFLTKEDVDDQLAFARSFAADGTEAVDVCSGGFHRGSTFSVRVSGIQRSTPRPNAERSTPRQVRSARYTLNEEPQPHLDLALGFLMVKPPPVMLSTKSTSAPVR